MKTINAIQTLFLFVLTATFALAQNVTFKAEVNRKSLAIGETLQVGFFIEADATDYSIDKPMMHPEHKGFRLIGEDKTQSVQYINGKGMIQDGIILVFNPEREGKLRIGSAKIVINGRTYTTKPIEIEVTKNSSTSARSSNANQPVFLQTNVSNTNPYINEQVGLTVKMYSKDLGLLNRKRNFRQGKLEGLNPKMISSRPETIKQEMVSGKPYFSEEIAKYNLFPQKPGRIEIDPFSLDILVSGIYGTEAYEIKSNSVIINAKELPTEGKPKNFNGAVGDFTMATKLDKNELKANESANFKIEIEGNGNFNAVIIPEVKTPKNLETYAPKKSNNFKNYDDGMQGSVASEMVIVPEYGGKYTIAPVEFTYFDPEKEQYITLTSEEKVLNVDGVTANETQNNSDDDLFGDQNESIANNDIVESVSEMADEVTQGNGKWVGLAGGVAIASVLAFILLRRKKEEQPSNSVTTNSYEAYQPSGDSKVKIPEMKETVFVANDETKKTLKSKLVSLQENIHTTDCKTFYQLQEDILCQIGMKFSGTDLANFSDYSVGEKLRQKGWNQNVIDEWKSLLSDARQAKYSAINSSNADLTDVYFKTEKLVNQFIK